MNIADSAGEAVVNLRYLFLYELYLWMYVPQMCRLYNYGAQIQI